MLCSTSARTRETAALVFTERTASPAIEFREDLYHAAPQQIVEILSQVAESIQSVMVIGHNPGFEEFVTQLTGEEIHFPTAGLAYVALELDHWNSFDARTRGQLLQMWRPKDFDPDDEGVLFDR